MLGWIDWIICGVEQKEVGRTLAMLSILCLVGVGLFMWEVRSLWRKISKACDAMLELASNFEDFHKHYFPSNSRTKPPKTIKEVFKEEWQKVEAIKKK